MRALVLFGNVETEAFPPDGKKPQISSFISLSRRPMEIEVRQPQTEASPSRILNLLILMKKR